MPHVIIPRPSPDEFAPYYHAYVAGMPDVDLLRLLEDQAEDTQALLRELGEERGDHRYAPGKWSVKEVVGHIVDAERVFAYRALCIARGDQTPLPGFDQDAYVAAAGFGRRALADLAEELADVRRASLRLLAGLDEEALGRAGVANGVPVTVRALAWIIAGHERHHQRLLRERYR